jgi:hypothetical protein
MLQQPRGFLFMTDARRAGGTKTAADKYVMCWFAHNYLMIIS